jgi:hypothetical protein
MDITMEIKNTPTLLNEFNRLGKALNLDSQQVMERAGRNVAIAAMRLTQPFGTTKKSQKQGEGAVAAGVVSAIKRSRSSNTSLGEAAQWHRANRDTRGKVPRGTTQIDAPSKVVDDLIKQQQARVGRAKAGFGAAAKQLGAPRIPKWIDRHQASWSSVKKSRRTWSPSVSINSALRYASATLTEPQQKKAAQAGIRTAVWGMKKQIAVQAGTFNRRQRR